MMGVYTRLNKNVGLTTHNLNPLSQIGDDSSFYAVSKYLKNAPNGGYLFVMGGGMGALITGYQLALSQKVENLENYPLTSVEISPTIASISSLGVLDPADIWHLKEIAPDLKLEQYSHATNAGNIIANLNKSENLLLFNYLLSKINMYLKEGWCAPKDIHKSLKNKHQLDMDDLLKLNFRQLNDDVLKNHSSKIQDIRDWANDLSALSKPAFVSISNVMHYLTPADRKAFIHQLKEKLPKQSILHLGPREVYSTQSIAGLLKDNGFKPVDTANEKPEIYEKV